MSTGQPDWQPELQRFKAWIDNNTEETYDITTGGKVHPGIVPIGAVEDYFKANRERLDRILEALFSTEKIENVPASNDVAETCPRGLCILLLIGKARFITTFVKHLSLFDEKLPFTNPVHPPPAFPSDTNDPNFYKKFCEEQWRFFSPKLKCHRDLNHDDDFILPFVQLEYEGGGRSGTVYKAVIHVRHDGLKDEIQQSSTRDEIPNTSHRNGHAYAVKTFKKKNAQRHYQRELAAFVEVTEAGKLTSPGMIRFFCGFQYRDTYNIVLEYADEGTLEDYFKKNARPSTPDEILSFWSGLLEITKALLAISEHHHKRKGKALQRQGWHQDIKPENILVISNGSSVYNYTFKIADLGLAHFKTIMEGDTEAVGLGALSITTYGAPECCPKSEYAEYRDNLIGSKVDIWSLGAVLSETSVWITQGFEGLGQYRHSRTTAINRIFNFDGGSCFHDGNERLPVVDKVHRDLRYHMHNLDFVTGSVVELLAEQMLNNDPSQRPTASQLQDRAEKLLGKADASLREYRAEISTRPTGDLHGVASPGEAGPSPRTPPNRNRTEYPSSMPFIKGTGRFSASPKSTEINMDMDPSAFNSSPQDRNMTAERRKPSFHNRTSLSTHYGGLSIISDPANVGQLGPEIPLTGRNKTRSSELYCSVEEAVAWHKTWKEGTTPKQLPHAFLMRELEDRDHVFIIDDSCTMKQHWPKVVQLVLVLAYMTKRVDKNGLDLVFLSSGQVRNFKASSTLAACVENRIPDGLTSLEGRFDNDLRDYARKIQRSNTKLRSIPGMGLPKKRSVYVFTDGVLDLGTNRQGYDSITFLVQCLKDANLPRNYAGVQFISFGTDQKGLHRLQQLDHLNKIIGLGLDIVDTEPSDRNIWKMLFGAINARFDEDDGERDWEAPQSGLTIAGPSSP